MNVFWMDFFFFDFVVVCFRINNTNKPILYFFLSVLDVLGYVHTHIHITHITQKGISHLTLQGFSHSLDVCFLFPSPFAVSHNLTFFSKGEKCQRFSMSFFGKILKNENFKISFFQNQDHASFPFSRLL